MTQLSPIGRFKKLLLSTDGSEFSFGATRLALHLAKDQGASLHLMTTVITNAEYEAFAPRWVEKAEEEAQLILHQVRQQAEAIGIPCQIWMRHGSEPAEEVLAVSEEISADVIVMGRRDKRKIARWMVSHSTVQTVGSAHCPVLVVPRAAEIPCKRILVATDGSRYSDNAAEDAVQLAKMLKLPLVVLSVILPSHGEKRRIEAKEAVDRVVEVLTQEGNICEGLVLEGKPHETIVKVAKEKGVDLIIVGNRGRTGLDRILMGSVSERVIGLADCPTFVACS